MHTNTARGTSGFLLFTESGKKALEENRDRHRKNLRQIRESLHGVRRRIGEIGSGNDSQNELIRQQGVEEKLLSIAERELAAAVVVEPATDTSVVAIGTIIKLRRYDSRGNPAGQETYLIGGYGSCDNKTVPVTLAYNSLLIKDLYGKPVDLTRGEEEVQLANGQTVYVELLEIRLPAQAADKPERKKLKLRA